MSQHSTMTAGIDVSKRWLDLAVEGGTALGAPRRVANTQEGHAEIVGALTGLGVRRVGLEASGGYEAQVACVLRGSGFEVIVFQPRQVRAYAVFRLRRAKTDAIDAALIAACTAVHEETRDAPDPRIAALREPLRLIEQIGEDIVRLKTRQEACRDDRVRARNAAEIARLKAEKMAEIKALLDAVRAEPDLARRLALVLSVPGLAERTALALLLHMPELGHLTREEAASLAGLAPFDDRSGRREGHAAIAGGREQVRTALYAAALPASFRWNDALMALYARLTAKGKSHKKALIACARKLLIQANAVLQRGTPWIPA